jgi:uncharacterized protein
MIEEKIFINNGPLVIESLLHKADTGKAVVICHPHSLRGGSMHNNVVEALQEAFASENYTTLRFNFRGVGASTGYYDEGNGEQRDIIAVCEYLKEQGFSELVFAGYSFGSWVGSKIFEGAIHPFSTIILVAPPLDYFDFQWNDLKDKIDLMICGDSDQFCSLNILKREAARINAPLKIIRGADHFYMGKERELSEILKQCKLHKT